MSKTRVVSLVFVIIMLIGGFNPVVVKAQISPDVLSEVRHIQPDFLENEGYINEYIYPLASDTGNQSYLVDFCTEERVCIGYAVVTDDIIVEFAEHESPYESYLQYLNNGISLAYESGFYSLLCGNGHARLDYSGEIIYCINVSSEYMTLLGSSMLLNIDSYEMNGTISGVSPQLQYSANCSAAALANVLWYWKSHGYDSLSSTFGQMKSDIIYYMNYCGGFANANVPAASNMYVYSRNNHYHCNSSVIWSPAVSSVTTEIDQGYPCMVGFNSSSPYYGSGHMTMCYGYMIQSGNMYVNLADGHSSSMVTRLWGNYNDCVISVRPYYS